MMSHPFFSRIADHLFDAIIVVDRAGRCVASNAAARRLTGYADAELACAPLADVIEPWEPPREDHWHRRFWQPHEAGEGGATQSFQVWRKDGARRLVAGRVLPVEGFQVYVLQDLTADHQQMAEALRESEWRYRQTVENSPNPIFSVSQDGIIRSWNKACEDTFRCGQEIVGQPIEGILCNPEDRSRLEAMMTWVFQGQSFGEVEVAFKCAGGGEWFSVSRLYPLFDHEGNVQECVFTNTDITGRRRAEAALRESEARYRTLFEGIDDAILVHDVEANILDVNEAACRRLGYTRDELLRMKITDIDAPDHAAGFSARLARQLAEGGLSKIDGVHIARDGRRIRVDVNTKLITYQGQPAILAVVRDVTELKEVQETLRRHAEQQTALYAIASMVGASLDPDRLFAAVLDWALPLLDTDAAWVALPGRTPEDLPLVPAWRGLPAPFAQAELPGHLRACVFCGAVLNADDAHCAPELIDDCPALLRAVLAKVGLLDCVGIPLRSGDRVLGVLFVARRAPYTYTDSERRLMVNIGHQVGIALRNAQLYQAARQVNRLRVLNRLDRDLAATLDPETAAEITLNQLAAAINAPSGAIAMFAPHTDAIPQQALVLNQGWVEITPHVKDPARVSAILQHLNDKREVVTLSSDDFAALIDGQDFAEYWGRSILVVPICTDEGLATVLLLGGRPADRPWTDEDRELARAAASRAGQAIQNARLYKAARAHADKLALLNEIGLALTRTLDYSTVVRAALSQIQALFGAEYVTLLQPDSETGELRYVQALFRGSPVEIPLSLKKGEGIAGWVLAHRRPELVEDVQRDPRWVTRVAQYLNMQTRAVMAVPLLTPEQVIGAIVVASEQRGAFTADHLDTLQAIAPTLAVALENARLYEAQKALLREREQAQVQLIHSAKMAALGRLMAFLAHEINNPLQAVQGCLDLALEELAHRRRRDKLERYLGIVSGEVERISAIMGRMLDFYHPAREGWRTVALHDVIDNVLALTDNQLQHRHVIVERAWADGLPAIQANPDHLKQVFLNLVLNAIDAMPNGGALRVTTAQDRILDRDGQQARPAVRVAFSDTGEGMSSETLAHVFEPFFTTKPHGSGLGLAVSYGIIESHRGQIVVESEAGAGTTVTILLPVEQ